MPMRSIVLAGLLCFLPSCALFSPDPQPAVDAVDRLDRIGADRFAGEMKLVDRIEDPAAQAEFRAFFERAREQSVELRGSLLDYLSAIGDVDFAALYKRWRAAQAGEPEVAK